MTATTPRVGFVGLGQIGAPMARRLVDWPGGLTVLDVVPEATVPFAQAGAAVATDTSELADCGVVCVMVRDDDQVRDVVGVLLDHLSEGAVVAIHSTIAADTAPALAGKAEAAGVHVLDAQVCGGPMGAQDGTLVLMVGGPPEVVEATRPVFDRMGTLVVHAGPVGSGTRMKLARNLLHFAAFTAAMEASRIAEAAGLDLLDLGRVVRHSDGVTGGPGAILHRASVAPMSPDDPWRSILDHVRLLGEKDLRHALQLADELGVEAPLGRLALDELGPGLGLPRKGTDDG